MVHPRRAVAALCLTLTLAAPCLAQGTAEEQAAAQALFDEAKALVAAGKAADACPKFEESQRLDPGLGTQLNLADCYERIGRTASAWTLYVDVASVAKRVGQEERAQHAESRAEALKSQLSKLVIDVPEASRVPGLEVKRGQAVVGSAQWGVAMPVDPGTQVVTASAPGKEPWSTNAVVAANAATVTITVPALKDAPNTPAPDAGSAYEQQTSGSSQRTIGLVVGGVGVVGLGVGSFFGLRAMGLKDDAGCDGGECPSEGAKSTYEDAQSAGTISTIAFVVGGVALGAGAVLYLTAKDSKEQVAVGASLTPGGALLGAEASW